MLIDRKFFLAAYAVLGLALAGCPKTSTVTPEEEAAAGDPSAEESVPEAAAPLDVPGIDVGSEWASVPSLSPVRFGYMKADLTPEARAALKKNAAVLKAVLKSAPSVELRVEGHCDDRGTLEYNLALGQRRANALRDYYQSLGVAKSSLKTVSYGEERPACAEVTEACWAENRRGETTLRSSQPVRIPLSELPQ